MTLDELLVEIERVPGNPRLLRALGGALGVELSKRRLDKLAPALRALARVARTASEPRLVAAPASASASADAEPPPGAFAAGYAAAATDVVGAFQAVLAGEADESEMAALARQPPFVDVLAALANGYQTPTAIAAQMGKHKSSASRALAALRDAGLVVAFSAPDGNERVRPHQLTPRGERVVELMRHPGRRRKATPARGTRIASAMTVASRERSGERLRAAPSAARKLR